MCWEWKKRNDKKTFCVAIDQPPWGSYVFFSVDITPRINWESIRQINRLLIRSLTENTPWFMASVIVDKRYADKVNLDQSTYPNKLASKYNLSFFTTSAFDKPESVTEKQPLYYLHIHGRFNMELILELMALIASDHLQFVFYGLTDADDDWQKKILSKNSVLEKLWFFKVPNEAVDTIRNDCDLLFTLDEGCVFYVLDEQQHQLANRVIEELDLNLLQN